MGDKKIIIYSPLPLWQIHFATDLEIAEISLSRGDDVYWISCNSDLQVCESNPHGLKSRCNSCHYCFRRGMNWLQRDRLTVLHLNNVTPDQQKRINSYTQHPPETLDELKSLEIDKSDIGLAVFSSLVSLLREPEPDLASYRDYLVKSIYSALVVHYSLANYISTIIPDKVYLFNGRYAELRPALRICQNRGIEVFTHDRAGVQGRYNLVPNSYPHSIDYVKSSIVDHWHHSDHTEREKVEISTSWYCERVEGKDQAWFSFIKKQEKGSLPIQFDENKRNIGIFVSSEDEFVAIVEWKNSLYRDHNDGVKNIIDEYKDSLKKDFNFYIRVHPNLSGLNNTQTNYLEKIATEYDFVTVIPPESQVDTYALVEAVDVVLTFGTTVGIEAANMGKPSILAGRAFYEDLDVVMRPSSHRELIELLNNDNYNNLLLKHPISKRGLAMYGYYQATFGKPYRHVLQKNVNQCCMVRNGKKYSISLNRTRRLARFVLGLSGY